MNRAARREAPREGKPSSRRKKQSSLDCSGRAGGSCEDVSFCETALRVLWALMSAFVRGTILASHDGSAGAHGELGARSS
jgi:hypothetical protein